MSDERSIVDEREKYLLAVRNLCTYYYTLNGVVKAVDNISYNVRQGEIVAIV